MLRRVAGSWFIWCLRSVSCVWFDEREGQDRPAHQINGPESLFAVCSDSPFNIEHSVPHTLPSRKAPTSCACMPLLFVVSGSPPNAGRSCSWPSTLLDSLRQSVRPRCTDSMNRPALKGATTAAGESELLIRVQPILGTAHRMRSPLPNARPRWGHK